MSWLDELSELERRAQARRAELAPQVARVESLLTEYDEVNQLLDRLSRERAGEQPAAAPATAATATAEPGPRTTRKRAARKRAARTTKPVGRAARTPAVRSAAAPKPAAAKPAARTSPSKPAASRDRARRRNAVRPGERERQLLELVAERPGITVPQVAAELSVDPTGLYGIVRRLQGKGRLSKDGAGLTITSSATEAVATAGAA